MKKIKIAITGNPNSGKTTIFNQITGASQKVGNWGGVTVDMKEGESKKGKYHYILYDLPGTYSLAAYTMEESVARDFIINGDSDIILNVIDSTNLERNLYLGIQLLEMGKPVIFSFNMSDELQKKGIEIDLKHLSSLLGIPIQFTTGRTGKGVDRLLETAAKQLERRDPVSHNIKIYYGEEIEREIKKLSDFIEKIPFNRKGILLRWYALKLLEDDEEIKALFRNSEMADKLFSIIEAAQKNIFSIYKEKTENVISEKRYGFIYGALGETVKKSLIDRIDISEKIDRIVTNRFLAYPIFALFMWILFQATFVIGRYPMSWIESLISLFGEIAMKYVPPSTFRNLLVEGIIGGVGGVIIFLPNIMILFLGISFLEDTGYMARIAFIMDKVMHKLGLHGKSFIPLLMGIGCTVPAIMAARTLESRKDRILTILVTPLITCSARLPVFILFAGAFFPDIAGNIIFLMYSMSFVFTFLVGYLFRKLLFRGEEYPFVMELPPYRLPLLKSSLIHMWQKAKHYLQKMGGVVLAFSVIIWFLSHYPQDLGIKTEYDKQIDEIEAELSLIDNNRISEEKEAVLINLKKEKQTGMIRKTFIGMAGQAIEPFIKPIGFDWRMGVSLITGFVAKEVVVSTIGVLLNAGDGADSSGEDLKTGLRNNYSPIQGLAFIFFVLLYTPCIVALITLIREVRSIKWSLFSVVYQISLAWLVSFGIFQIGTLLIQL